VNSGGTNNIVLSKDKIRFLKSN
jgi:hypothetical protein